MFVYASPHMSERHLRRKMDCCGQTLTLDTGNTSRGGGLLSSFFGLVGLKHSDGLIHLDDTNIKSGHDKGAQQTTALSLVGPHCLLLCVQLTFERRDSGDSNMCRSSELSISSSMPVILPARLGCMLWIRGNRRSPEKHDS